MLSKRKTWLGIVFVLVIAFICFGVTLATKWSRNHDRVLFIDLVNSSAGVECHITSEQGLLGSIFEQWHGPSAVGGLSVHGRVQNEVITSAKLVGNIEYLIVGHQEMSSQQELAKSFSGISVLTIHLNPTTEPANPEWIELVNTKSLKCMIRGTSWNSLPNWANVKHLSLYSPSDHNRLSKDFVAKSLQSNPQLETLTLLGGFLSEEDVGVLVDSFPNIIIESD